MGENAIEQLMHRYYLSMRRSGRAILFASGAGVLAGLATILTGVLGHLQKVELRDAETWTVAGFLILLPSVLPFVGTLRTQLSYRNIEDWEPFVAVAQPKRIVWVFFDVTTIRIMRLFPVVRRGIVFCEENGKRHELGINDAEMKCLEKAVGPAFPHATTGWHPALEQAFRTAPASLRRAPNLRS